MAPAREERIPRNLSAGTLRTINSLNELAVKYVALVTFTVIDYQPTIRRAAGMLASQCSRHEDILLND
ncbi:hypothetical protein ABKN59_003967 [Abortiporus biennis]